MPSMSKGSIKSKERCLSDVDLVNSSTLGLPDFLNIVPQKVTPPN
jgi:hypothetical protein